MKTKLFLILPLAALSIFTSSCRSTKMNALATRAYAPVANINEIRAVIDVDMKKKLTGESATTYLFCFKINGDNKYADGVTYSGKRGFLPRSIESARSAAAYKAVENSGADLIIHPNYVVEVEKFIFFKKINVKVTGYAGYFKNFYQAEYCDPCSNSSFSKKDEKQFKKD